MLESSLNGKEKTLAWLKRSQVRGGFRDHCTRGDAPLVLENEDTAYMFHLVNRCNLQVLQLTVSPTIRILGLYLLRLTLSDTIKAHEAELRNLRPILLSCVTQGLALKAAIQHVCRDETAGNEILFSDMLQKLSRTIQEREQLLEAFNAVAPDFGFDPIDLNDLESSVSDETEKQMDELVRLSRARAAVDFDCRHEARELLLPLIEPEV
jgi:hypothetical protein